MYEIKKKSESEKELTFGILIQQFSTAGCGKTKGCLFIPDSCGSSPGNCDYFLTYTPERSYITFEMSSNKKWVAVGFNRKAIMVIKDTFWYSVCLCLDINFPSLNILDHVYLRWLSVEFWLILLVNMLKKAWSIYRPICQPRFSSTCFSSWWTIGHHYGSTSWPLNGNQQSAAYLLTVSGVSVDCQWYMCCLADKGSHLLAPSLYPQGTWMKCLYCLCLRHVHW